MAMFTKMGDTMAVVGILVETKGMVKSKHTASQVMSDFELRHSVLVENRGAAIRRLVGHGFAETVRESYRAG